MITKKNIKESIDEKSFKCHVMSKQTVLSFERFTSFKAVDQIAAGMFCRLQVAGCELKFNYNWKTADTLEERTSGRLTVTVT